MQGDIFRGRWHELKGKVRRKWGKLTNDDIEEISGKREELLGKLQARYGWQQKQAEEELKRFETTLQGERGQKISAEYEREEDVERFSEREEETSETKQRDTGKGNKTEKFNREYFERSEEEEKGEDNDQGHKRKVR